MKLNWINLLATVLILGGVLLLVQKRMTSRGLVPIPTAATVEDARADFRKRVETSLGRPLNDAEVQMIGMVREGNQVHFMLQEPLKGRVYQAMRAAAATRPGAPVNPNGLPQSAVAPSAADLIPATAPSIPSGMPSTAP